MGNVTLTNLDNSGLTRQCRTMNGQDPTGKDWSDGGIDLILADYFDMLRMELSGLPFVKLHRNKALQEMTGRSKGSIEFKHQNISAVLRKLGMPWMFRFVAKVFL